MIEVLFETAPIASPARGGVLHVRAGGDAREDLDATDALRATCHHTRIPPGSVGAPLELLASYRSGLAGHRILRFRLRFSVPDSFVDLDLLLDACIVGQRWRRPTPRGSFATAARVAIARGGMPSPIVYSTAVRRP